MASLYSAKEKEQLTSILGWQEETYSPEISTSHPSISNAGAQSRYKWYSLSTSYLLSQHITLRRYTQSALRVHISGVTKCVTKFLSKTPHCESVKNFVTHFLTPETWTLNQIIKTCNDKDNEKHGKSSDKSAIVCITFISFLNMS